MAGDAAPLVNVLTASPLAPRDSLPTRSLRARAFVVTLFAAALVATLLVSVLPFVRFAYRSPSLHLVLEMLTAFGGSLAAYLVYGRFRRSADLRDLGIVGGLILLCAPSVAFGAVPAIATRSPNDFAIWAALSTRVAGAGVLAAAAIAHVRTVRAPRRAAVAVFALIVLVATLAAVEGIVLSGVSPGIDSGLSPEASGRPRIIGHPALLTAQLMGMALLLVAALGFLRRAERANDELMTWLAGGAVLGAVSRLNYFLFPSIYTDWVYTGDVVRAGFWLLVLFGASREIAGYWRSVADAAVLSERSRIARDLHDGLAQELAFITARARLLAHGTAQSSVAASVAAAAERALDESRGAIWALTLPLDEPLDRTIAQAAEDVAVRAEVEVDLDLGWRGRAPHEVQQTLVRIVREAITNATRHGAARAVAVRLRGGDALHLEIEDDGCGFDPRDVDGRGFGLRSMKERANAVGGTIVVSAARGRGTIVRVAIPWPS
jgi:signal transduction histidine kinase